MAQRYVNTFTMRWVATGTCLAVIMQAYSRNVPEILEKYRYHILTFLGAYAVSQPMGVYGTSTFRQGDAVTPSPHPAPSSSQCSTVSSLSNGATASMTSSSAMTSATVSASNFHDLVPCYPFLCHSVIFYTDVWKVFKLNFRILALSSQNCVSLLTLTSILI